MSGRKIIGEDSAWSGGSASPLATCVLAPNPSMWTLDGTNTWLVGAPGGDCVIIDPGPLGGGHEQAILNTVEERNGRVTNVLLTHGHHDHSEGALELAQRLQVPVRSWDPDLMGSWRDTHSALSEGETLTVNGADLRVIATPGHSSDSVCFLVGSAVITGDTVLGRGTSVIAHPDGRLSEYLISLQALSRLCEEAGIDQLLPGHGPLIADPQRVVDYYITHRQERLLQIRHTRDAGATTVAEIVSRVYADLPSDVRRAAEMAVEAQLVFLDEEEPI